MCLGLRRAGWDIVSLLAAHQVAVRTAIFLPMFIYISRCAPVVFSEVLAS